jgi:hypothetical protein
MTMTPFEQLLSFNLSDGQNSAQASFPVSPDDHPVIEFITAELTVGIGQKPTVVVNVQTGDNSVGHRLVLFSQGTFGGGDLYAASQLVKLYPSEGSQVVFQVLRNSTSGPASGDITVTGFLPQNGTSAP